MTDPAQMKNDAVQFSQPILSKTIEVKRDNTKGKAEVPRTRRSSKLIKQQRENHYTSLKDKGDQSLLNLIEYSREGTYQVGYSMSTIP